MSEWKPIETASAVGKKKLMFWTKSGLHIVGFRIARSNAVISTESKSRFIATHWMPLPNQPHT